MGVAEKEVAEPRVTTKESMRRWSKREPGVIYNQTLLPLNLLRSL